MFKKLDHIGIGTADFERFIEFYTDILGFKVREMEGRTGHGLGAGG